MKTEYVNLEYQLTFAAAFHFGTGLCGGIVHRLAARDAEGFLYVPGSTLKGVLRERCEQLADLFDLRPVPGASAGWREASPDVDIVSRIFGNRFHPGRLCFDDAAMNDGSRALFQTETNSLRSTLEDWQTEKRTQVSMSRLTGTARSGHLYTSEYGISGLDFTGRIGGMLTGVPLGHFYATNLKVGSYPLLLLVAGLLSLDRLGANKSAGAGQVRCEIGELRVADQIIALSDLLSELPAMDAEFYELCKEEVSR